VIAGVAARMRLRSSIDTSAAAGLPCLVSTMRAPPYVTRPTRSASCVRAEPNQVDRPSADHTSCDLCTHARQMRAFYPDLLIVWSMVDWVTAGFVAPAEHRSSGTG